MEQEEYYLLVVDVDPNRLVPVVINHANREGNNVISSEKPTEEYDLITDMAKLCEAICLMIHLENNEGGQKDYDSLKMCIDHLELRKNEFYIPKMEKLSNEAFLVDIGHPDNKTVSIVHLNRTYAEGSETENGSDNIKTMSNLCEALLVLMSRAHESQKKKKVHSLEDCVNHLQKGFLDSSYKTNTSTADKW